MVVGLAVVDTGALVVVAFADVADVVAFTVEDVVTLLVVGADDSETFLVVVGVVEVFVLVTTDADELEVDLSP